MSQLYLTSLCLQISTEIRLIADQKLPQHK